MTIPAFNSMAFRPIPPGNSPTTTAAADPKHSATSTASGSQHTVIASIAPSARTNALAAIGARNSRYLLKRAQTDPPQCQWFSEPQSNLRSIDDAKFDNEQNCGALTRSASDGFVTPSLAVALASTSISVVPQKTPCMASRNGDAHTSAESLPKCAKKCYKRLSSTVSIANIPAIPEQLESATSALDEAEAPIARESPSSTVTAPIAMPKGALVGRYGSITSANYCRYSTESGASSSFESTSNDLTPLLSSGSSNACCANVRVVDVGASAPTASSMHFMARRIRPFLTRNSQTIPPATSYYPRSSAERRGILHEQRSSSASTRRSSNASPAVNNAQPTDKTNKSCTTASRVAAASQNDSANARAQPAESTTRHRVLEFLHCGTMESACDGAQLCAHRIAYIVNLTGFELPKRQRRPCKCVEPRYHTLTELTDVELSKALALSAIFSRFERVNAFIAEARSRGVQVLLFGNEVEYCHTMALQYMMHYHRISLAYARTHLERHSGRLRLAPHLTRMLEMWEMRLSLAANALEVAPFLDASLTGRSASVGNKASASNAPEKSQTKKRDANELTAESTPKKSIIRRIAWS